MFMHHMQIKEMLLQPLSIQPIGPELVLPNIVLQVFVEAPEFRGVRLVKQHRLVTLALKAEIGEMHGIRIATQASPGCGE